VDINISYIADWTYTSGIKILLIILLAIVAKYIIVTMFRSVILRITAKSPSKEYRKRLDTIIGILSNASGIIIFLVAIMMVLSVLGFNVAPLVTGAGIMGFAFGFGSQTLIRDIIAGFFVILENQFNQGDTIQVSGNTGRVLSIGLRTTILEDKEGNRYLIPNSKLGIITILKKGD